MVQAFTAKVWAEAGALTPQRFKELMNEVKAETGVKGKDLFHPVRIILTGAHSGPEFDKLIPLVRRRQPARFADPCVERAGAGGSVCISINGD